jgi:glycosyltransferase involved in cell wall biosynthesis
MLSVVIPCYNEERTLKTCVEKVLSIRDGMLSVELLIVDDCSKDRSHEVALGLQREHPEVRVLRHQVNQGKGAALRTGFAAATGDFVAVQDADLEYDPWDLKQLLVPLVNGDADVVFGSRFLASGAHRVLYFWHSLGNRFLTLLSNMFTDLNLTDMETCYKVFRRDVIQRIDLTENRFGFDPEVVAKVAQLRLRVYEMGVTYHGRTYAEGKKIGARDGFRALYCILRYSAHRAPAPIQFLAYLFVGGSATVLNLLAFLLLYTGFESVLIAAPVAYVAGAAANYFLSIALLFRHGARWSPVVEVLNYVLVVVVTGALDLLVTSWLLSIGLGPAGAKLIASASVLVPNFLGRRYLVFPQPPTGPWAPQRTH